MISRPVILIGLPGAGKTTVGRLLAPRLGLPFADLDRTVELRAGCSIAEFFERLGEAEFRRAEAEAMAELLGGAPHVIAAGGGWAAQPEALSLVRRRADPIVVYLRVTPAHAALRLGTVSDRPLLLDGNRNEQLAGMLAIRSPFYQRADLSVATDDRPPEAVAQEIARLCLDGSRRKSL